MRKGWIIGVAVMVLVAVVCLAIILPKHRPDDRPPQTTTTTTEEAPPPDALHFTGRVLETDGDSVLMKCLDSDRFDTVWVHVPAAVTPRVGEEYVVYHEDLVMPSLPPRITAVRMDKQ